MADAASPFDTELLRQLMAPLRAAEMAQALARCKETYGTLHTFRRRVDTIAKFLFVSCQRREHLIAKRPAEDVDRMIETVRFILEGMVDVEVAWAAEDVTMPR